MTFNLLQFSNGDIKKTKSRVCRNKQNSLQVKAIVYLFQAEFFEEHLLGVFQFQALLAELGRGVRHLLLDLQSRKSGKIKPTQKQTKNSVDATEKKKNDADLLPFGVEFAQLARLDVDLVAQRREVLLKVEHLLVARLQLSAHLALQTLRRCQNETKAVGNSVKRNPVRTSFSTSCRRRCSSATRCLSVTSSMEQSASTASAVSTVSAAAADDDVDDAVSARADAVPVSSFDSSAATRAASFS